MTSVTNGTSTAPSSNYTLCSSTGTTDYNGIKLLGGGTTNFSNGGSVNVTYEQSVGCRYVADNTSRTLVNLVLVFFAIAILAIAYFYLRQSGMFDMF